MYFCNNRRRVFETIISSRVKSVCDCTIIIRFSSLINARSSIIQDGCRKGRVRVYFVYNIVHQAILILIQEILAFSILIGIDFYLCIQHWHIDWLIHNWVVKNSFNALSFDKRIYKMHTNFASIQIRKTVLITSNFSVYLIIQKLVLKLPIIWYTINRVIVRLCFTLTISAIVLIGFSGCLNMIVQMLLILVMATHAKSVWNSEGWWWIK